MARTRKWRHAVATAVFCAAAAAGGNVFLGSPGWLTGLLFDTAVFASAAVRQDATGNSEPQVAIIAIDGESLSAPELAPYPRALFGPVWALMIPALQDAGARAIAFDAVFSYSANQFQSDYDQTFLKALNAAKDRIVIGYSSRLLPTQTHMAALALDQDALGSLDLFPQEDGILRTHIGRQKTPEGETFLGLAGAALARAGISDIPGEIILAPTRHPEALPTYSLIDVLRCAGTAPQALQTAFAGKIVFVGTNLPEEDRVVSSSRFLPPPETPSTASEDCALRCLPASAPDSGDGPGVHLFAVAAQSVLDGHIVTRVAAVEIAMLAGAAALAGVAIGFTLAPVVAVAAVVLSGILLWGLESLALIRDLWLDTANPIIAVIAAAIIAYMVRYVIEERSRKRIQNAFGHYLAPTLVDRLADSENALQLGGEQRDVTIMFADLSGFTALSGILGPEALVETTNAYLKIIADEVDASGGYIDKFIGDAVMAIWGAPVADGNHPAHAVAAALKVADTIAQKRELAIAKGEHAFDIKVGINSGLAVVGNVGSEKRYNYTAVGEAVNIAARLEGLPGVYKCRVIVGPDTADRLDGVFPLREIDAVTVKGKTAPLRIFEPFPASAPPPDPAYGDALALYRNRDFAAAASIWNRLSDTDGPASVMAARALVFADDPPPDNWNGVFVMSEK